MNANRINLTTLGVSDLKRSVAFYQSLGWKAEEVLETVAFFDMDGAKFGLFPMPALAHEQKRPIEELGVGACTHSVNFPTEADVDTAFQNAIAAGATSIAQPTKMEWGGYSSYWADPDGHVWEFAYNPWWELNENGWIK